MCVCFSRQLHAAHFQMRCLAAAAARQKCLLLPLEHGRMLPLLPLQFFVRRRPSFLSVFFLVQTLTLWTFTISGYCRRGWTKSFTSTARGLRGHFGVQFSSSAPIFAGTTHLLTYSLTFLFLGGYQKKSSRLPSSVVVLVLQRRSSTERFFAPKGKFSESETNLFFLFLFFHRHSTQYRRKRIAPSSFHCL